MSTRPPASRRRTARPGRPRRHRPASPDAPRRAALQVLERIDRGLPWNAAWAPAAAALADARDRRFVYELASGTVRLRGRLHQALRPCVHRELGALQPAVRRILELGAYQLLEMDRVAPHAAVHASVELAASVAPAATGLVNAVLRALARSSAPLPEPDPADLQSLAGFFSHPAWILERWWQRFGEVSARRLCAYDNRPPRLGVCLHAGGAAREAFLTAFPGSRPGAWSERAVWLEPGSWEALQPWLEKGEVSIQDESAQIVGAYAGARPGETWVDLAAAPGGKTAWLVEQVGPGGRVVAMERSPQRLTRLCENARRLAGAAGRWLLVRGDARRPPVRQADGVLLDAPCTGLGVLARRPDARWRKRPEDLPRLAALQLEMLAAAAGVVRPGGTLVYSVCSFEPEETSEVVAAFGERHPEFTLEHGPAPSALHAGEGILYFFPQRHEIDGGFVARWKRRA